MYIKEEYFLFINIFIALTFISMILLGYLKGALYELISILYSILSVFIAWFTSPVLASTYPLIKISELYPESELFVNIFNLDPLVNTLLYFVLVFVTLRLLHFIIQLILKGFNKVPVLGSFNRMLGALIGVINGFVVTLVISIIFTLPVFKNGTEIKEKTIIKYINGISNKAITYVIENNDFNQIKKYFDEFDIEKLREDFKNLIS